VDDLTELSRLRSRIESLEAENGRLARALSVGTTASRGAGAASLARARLADVERQLEEMTAAYAAASARAESAEQMLGDVTGSPSWQLTAPLRALKRRMRRGTS
jgi:chromosome segregation ATPase